MRRKPDRREFLKTGLVTAATMIASGPAMLINPERSFGQSAPDVVISHGRNPATMTRAAVDGLGGMKRFVKAGAKVVIKPNMSFASGPQSGSNTHPAVVSEVAKMCAEAGASRISILDNVLQQPQDCLSLSKIPEQCEKVPNTSVHVIKGQRLFKEISLDRGTLIKSMGVATEVLDADVLIAVPVGKSHSSAGVSLSMKGMMGLIFDNDRRSFHTRGLQEAIVDMVTILKPHLVVIDGTRILSSGGPGGPGDVIPLNLVVASTDMVAADAQMVALGTWYGKKLEPRQVKHISMAAERGLGRMDLDKLSISNITA
ncbi:MAG TPA: DUF362 domain-containing protein [Desulfomonilaceae bacterium]|nr:DUF362 domain-containing protein [Desulfomonilaceae bacterium]